MSENDDYTTRVIRRKTTDPAAASGSDPEKTQLVARATPPALPGSDDDRTRVHRGSDSDAAGSVDHSSPVVGWLVIMAGPGRGNSLTLGFGMNHIGRSATNRIVIDFGDEEISRKTHTTVTYDPRGKKFYVQPGPDATNLTYVGEEPNLKPVLTPTEITGTESITLGRTKLKFVPFCGPGFSWD